MADNDNTDGGEPTGKLWTFAELAEQANDLVEILHHHARAFTIAADHGSTLTTLKHVDAVIFYMAARAFLEAATDQLDGIDPESRKMVDKNMQLVDTTNERKIN